MKREQRQQRPRQRSTQYCTSPSTDSSIYSGQSMIGSHHTTAGQVKQFQNFENENDENGGNQKEKLIEDKGNGKPSFDPREDEEVWSEMESEFGVHGDQQTKGFIASLEDEADLKEEDEFSQDDDAGHEVLITMSHAAIQNVSSSEHENFSSSDEDSEDNRITIGHL